jgi:GNAT superfamily N-acetyltransferase
MIQVRNCLPEDEKAVFALVSDFATSFSVDQLSFSRSFSQVLLSADMYLAVAQSSDVIVGYVLGTAHPTFYASGHVAWVEEIMVKEAVRREGVGRLLMENFESWAKSRGCRLVALATRRAAEFYKCLGYIESATYFRKIIRDA